MKILHVITDMNIGGAGVWVRNYLNYADKKHEIHVVIPRGSLLKDYLEVQRGARIHEIDHIGDRSFSLRGIGAMVRLLRRILPDVLHTHASFSARIAGKILGIPKVYNSRHCVVPVPKGNFKKRLVVMLDQFLSHQIIAVSEGVYENYRVYGYDQEKVLLINNGVDPIREITDYEKLELRRQLNLKQEDKIILYMGRLEAIKGPLRLLEIGDSLREQAINGWTIVVAGEGSLKEEMEASIQSKGLDAYFRLIGFVEDPQPYYGLAYVVVNTSTSEAISLSLLEAMSGRKPVVAFDVDGLSQVVHHEATGYLVEPFATETFSNRLLALLKDEALAEEMGNNGYEWMMAHHQLKDMVHKLEKHYEVKI